jgi:hypothetical protein
MAMRFNTTTSLRFLTFASWLFLMSGCVAAPDPDDTGELEATEGVASPIINGSMAMEYPEAALVDMQLNGEPAASCSGAVIAPRVVLTAGHCIFGFNGWVITTPFASGQKSRAREAVTYDWQVPSEFVDPRYHDVGLIFLDRPIRLSSYPAIATRPVPRGKKIVNIGRIQNGRFSSSALFVSKPMEVEDGAASGFPFDYAASEIIQSGDSGGPDLLVNTHSIVAVNSGAGNGVEVLARVDLLSGWIQDQIDAHGGSGPSDGEDEDSGGDPGNLPSGASESEPNDSPESPNDLSGALEGRLVGGDEDWFTWALSDARMPYDVRIDASGDAELRMWKLIQGRYYLVASPSSTRIAHLSAGAGRYLVAAFSPSGQSQRYTLTLSR